MRPFETGLVSVMMPAYNAERYIGEAIRSVLAQTYANWELLVVNDGSTDRTAAAAAAFDDPRVRVIGKENGGESSARNVALEHSRGEYIAYLDADDAYLPHHLEVTVGHLRTHPEHDAVYTDGFHIDEEGRRLPPLQSRRRGPFEGHLYEQLVLAPDVFGPPMCVVLRHDLVARHRLRYDPRIVIGPDWDFFVRFAERATFGYLPDRTGLYRVHRSNITVQVGLARRAGYLAICRENAIGSGSFHLCSERTRSAVFYDLLVNLLRGQAARRASVASWPQFAALPPTEQCRLLRLTATDALLDGDLAHVGGWLERAVELNGRDRRARLLAAVYRLSPALAQAVVRAIAPLRTRTGVTPPFADLEAAMASHTRPAEPAGG